MHSHNSYSITTNLQSGDIVYDKDKKHFVIIEFVSGSQYAGFILTSNNKYQRINLTQYGFKPDTHIGSEVRGSLSNLKKESGKFSIFGYAN